MLDTDVDYLKELNTLKTVKPPEYLVSEFITKNRIMPPGSPFPGLVDLSLTPYAIEWMDVMSPYSEIQHIAILKSAQVAATFAIENILAYWMKEYPAAIMYMSGTKDLLEEWGTKRLEPMIDSCGIRDKIVDNADDIFNRKSRRTGDKVFSKQFVGGFLKMVSAQSASSQRSDSIRLLIRDEIESAPKELSTGEGSFLKTTLARTKFFGDRRKIVDLSTPSLLEGNYIETAYKEGDQRKYFMPCPKCGTMQCLEPIPEEGNFGLRGIQKDNRLQEVYYICIDCKVHIQETSKTGMFKKSVWKPTATSKSELYRTYYINSLYSPLGTFSWRDYYLDWLDSNTSVSSKKTFLNLSAGLSYQETGERPKISLVQHLRGSYAPMVVPHGVLYLTCAIDVQSGASKYMRMTQDEFKAYFEKNPQALGMPRLELEILGHGVGYRTWSIDYKVFVGKLTDVKSGAWLSLYNFYKSLSDGSGLTSRGAKLCSIKRLDGLEFDIPVTFIDAGDGLMSDTVATFCQMMGDGFYPSMGTNALKTNTKNKGDYRNADDVRKYKPLTLDKSQQAYVISTNYYKSVIYNRARIDRTLTEIQKPGFMDHPKTFTDGYFKQLFAEDQHADGTFHAGSRRNEALDCKVYNICAGDVYLGMLIEHERGIQAGRGKSAQQLRSEITANYILEGLSKLKGL